MIITNPDPYNIRTNLNKITHDICEWFETNLVSLNLDKPYYMQFVTKNNFSNDFDFNIIHRNKKIATVNNIKFLGITLDSTLS